MAVPQMDGVYRGITPGGEAAVEPGRSEDNAHGEPSASPGGQRGCAPCPLMPRVPPVLGWHNPKWCKWGRAEPMRRG